MQDNPLLGCCFRRIKFLTEGGTISSPFTWPFSAPDPDTTNLQPALDSIFVQDQLIFPLQGAWFQSTGINPVQGHLPMLDFGHTILRTCLYNNGVVFPGDVPPFPVIYPLPINANPNVGAGLFFEAFVNVHQMLFSIGTHSSVPNKLRGRVRLDFYVGVLTPEINGPFIPFWDAVIRLTSALCVTTNDVNAALMCVDPVYTANVYRDLFDGKAVDGIEIRGNTFGPWQAYNQSRTLSNVTLLVA